MRPNQTREQITFHLKRRDAIEIIEQSYGGTCFLCLVLGQSPCLLVVLLILFLITLSPLRLSPSLPFVPSLSPQSLSFS